MSIESRPVAEPQRQVLEGEHYSACLRLFSLDDVELNYAHVVLNSDDANFARKSHLFTHQIHHRGQVHDMLAATSVAPPQLDQFFLSSDLPLRAAELKVLNLPIE